MANKSFAVREFNVERRSIPLAIQTYFWQQTSPLLKTKLEKKEYEAASESLKNVICENNLQGLPSAFKSVPRWFFVHSSLAYIIQCCSALLSNRHQLGYFDRLTNPERDLIYTLHWILFEAPGICGIEDPENLLHPISTVELFVHLLIPHVNKIKEKDLTNRLESGLVLWKPLQAHQVPELPAFCHPVLYKDPNSEDFVGHLVGMDPDASAHNSQTSDSKKSVSESLPFSSASFFDVAVLRCLLSNGWCEEGVYWSLIYITDYLRREYDLPGAKEKQKFASSSGTSWGRGRGGEDTESIDSFGGCVLNNPIPPAPKPAEAPKHDVQIHISNEEDTDKPSQDTVTTDSNKEQPPEQTEAAVARPEDIHFTMEDDDDDMGKLIIPDDENRYSLTKLKIRVDSPVSGRRGPVYSVTDKGKTAGMSTEKELSSSQSFYISITPSTPTLEMVDEVNNGSTNKGFDFNIPKTNGVNDGDNVEVDETIATDGTKQSQSIANDKQNVPSDKVDKKTEKDRKQSEKSTASKEKSGGEDAGVANGSKALDVDKTIMNHFSMLNNMGSSSELSLESVSSLGEGTITTVSPSSGSNEGKIADSFSSITSQLECEEALLRGSEKDTNHDKKATQSTSSTSGSKTIEAQSSLSSDEPPSEPKQETNTSQKEQKGKPQPKASESKFETTSSDIPTSDIEKRSLIRDSSTETQDTAEAVSLQPSLGTLNVRRSLGRGIRDSMFRIEHYLVFPGVGDYVTADGRLSIMVLLQAVNGVLKENLSGRVCQIGLKVLELLLMIHDKEKERKRASTVSSTHAMDDRTVAESMAIGARMYQTETILSRLRPTFYGRPPTIYTLSLGCGIRLIRALGCPLGCGEGCHAYRGDILREQSNAYLASLQKQDDKAFKGWLSNYARIEPVEDVVDFLHALVGFCDECNPFATDEEETGGKKNKGKLFGIKEGVEGVILDALVKALVSRVAEMKLTELDALTFYGELRQLLRYIKDNYGGVFWKVAMSGLMDCAYKGKKEEATGTSKDTSKPLASKDPARTVKKEPSISKMTPKTTRRKFFKGQKFGRTTDGSENDLRTLGSSSLSGSRAISDGTSLEDTMSPRSKRKIFSLGAWRKQRAIGQTYDSDEDGEDSPDASLQQISLKKKRFKEKSRKKLDDVFPMKSSSKKLITSSSSSLPDNGSPTIDIVVHEYERRPVDVGALREGMIRLRFLVNASQPGAVPDPHIVAAMLELEAPVVARAALLLECAHLVHRCNKGEWPTWLRGSLPNLAQRKGNAPKAISLSTPRRNLVAMHEAGKLFHSWGVALGQKLEMVLKKKKQSLPSIQEEEGKRVEMLEDELEEDFLDEGTLSESSQGCPYPLKMIACQLLIEITAFLRESHGIYQIRRDSKGMQGRGRGRKSFGGGGLEKRRSTHFGDTHPIRLSGYFGGGGERIRKYSAISQSSVPSEISTTVSTSPGRSSPHEPPVIIVPDQEGKAADDSILLRRRASDIGKERKLSDIGPQDALSSPKRSSLHLPRSSLGSSSPKLNKTTRSSVGFGSDFDSTRPKGKRATVKGKRQSGPDSSPSGTYEDEDDSEDDETTRFPWLHSVTILNSFTSYLCDHQTRCPSNCHQRQTRLCARLIKALQNVYSGSNSSDKTLDRSEREKPEKLDKSKSKTGFTLTSIGSPQHSLSGNDIKNCKERDDEVMLEYIKSKLCGLTHCAFSLISKAGTVIDRELLEETLPISWELLLDGDQQLVSAAASVFLLCGIRLKDKVTEMLYKELTCNDPDDRVRSLLRYEVLWQSRYHAWPRLEEGASYVLRVPPPKVDFTLPSPPLGLQANHAPDCPWDPVMLLEEQPGNRKTKNKDKKKVKEAEEAEAKKKMRQNFPLRTLPVSLEATMGSNDEEKAGRWFHLKWEQAQGRVKDENLQPESGHQVNAELWPAGLSSAIPHIIKLLDDVVVDSYKTAVMEVAYRIIWNCLVEDPVLFFRTILEDITKKDKQEELIVLISKLFMYIDKLPPAAARFLLNNLVGVVMYYARTNRVGAQDSVALILSLTWKLVPSVRGLYFKDIKQSLRKEHCEGAMLVFANVPGAKKLSVTCCGKDGMTERIPVNDDMTFGKVISYLRSRFNLEETDLYLIDTKSDLILEERDFVRDVFSFRKGFPSPQLKLELVDPGKAFLKRQAQAFTNKLADTGRIMLCASILNALPNQKHSSFLQEEFSRQISFPRKALACEFGLYGSGAKGNELFGMDVIHKMYWVNLIVSLLQYMPRDFPWSFADLTLFLNVINGAILLHCEDTAMIRLCMASLINICIHFDHIFISDGFQFIFPSLLQVYAHHQGNDMVRQAVEFTMSQFYILHQKPCILQLLASVAPILQVDTKLQNPTESSTEDPLALVSPKCLFSLLNSLDVTTPDNLDILELVYEEKPLRPLDSCYDDNNDPVGESKVDEAIRLCVTVVDFAPESKRSAQMLVVLSAILPYYLEFLAEDSQSGDLEQLKKEAQAITSLSALIKVLIKSSDVLTRSFVHFQSFKSMTDRTHLQHSSWQSTTSLNVSNKGSISSYDGPQYDEEEEDGEGRHGPPLLERLRALKEKNEVMEALEVYRKPRNALLVLVADYVSICTQRVEILKKNLPARLVIPDLLDDISIILLAEILYSLMKLAVYDPVTMSSPGVQRYMLKALPVIDWLPEAVEPAVNLVLKRLSKIFDKLIQKPDLVRNIEWKALDSYVRGIYMVLCHQTYIAKSQYLKSLVTTCISFVLEERPSVTISLTAFLPMAPICAPPAFFCDTIMRLAARLMFLLKNEYTLQELCGGSSDFGYPVRTEKVFVRILLPILIRLGSRRPDAPHASPEDVVFALKCFLRVVTTKNSDTPGAPPTRLSVIQDECEAPRALSISDALTSTGGTHIDTIPDSLYDAAYLGLKILVICFEDELSTEWFKIFNAVDKIVDNDVVGTAFWDFIHFVVSYRTPLYIMIMPLVQTKVSQLTPSSPTERAFKQQTLDRLARPHHVCNCKKAVIEGFLEELNILKGNTKAKPEEPTTPNTIMLSTPPTGRSADNENTKTQQAEEENGSKPSKKTVTFSRETKHEDLGMESESRNSQDQRRKKWIMHKHSSIETTENGTNSDTVDSPFEHKRGTGYRGRKTPAALDHLPASRERKNKLGLPSSFSEDGESVASNKKTESMEMEVLKSSLSLPIDLDKDPVQLSIEKLKEVSKLQKEEVSQPEQDSNLPDQQVSSPKRKPKLEKQGVPIIEDVEEETRGAPGTKQGRSPRKMGLSVDYQNMSPEKRELKLMDEERSEKKVLYNEDSNLANIDVNMLDKELKETILDEKTLGEGDLDVMSSDSSPSKYGIDESDEEFLDAMSEWPKEVALAMERLNSPHLHEEHEEWKEDDDDHLDNIIPMYPCSSTSTVAKRQLDGIASYVPQPMTTKYHEVDETGNGRRLNEVSSNHNYTHAHASPDMELDEFPCLNLPLYSPLPNGPSTSIPTPNIKSGLRSDSSPDVLESIKPSPPVEPSFSSNKRRSVPSYVIKINGPLDEHQDDEGGSRMWHRLHSGNEHGKTLVPLASEEHIGSELSIVFGNAASLDDFSRETNV